MKRFTVMGGLMLAALAAVMTWPQLEPIAAAMAQNVACFKQQGGAKNVAASGCEFEFRSGSILDIQSGTTLTLDIALDMANGESLNTATDDVFDFTRDDAGTVTITASDNDATAALTVLPGGAAALTLGGASTTAITLTTDGTGDGEVVLPAGSVGAAELTYAGRDWFNICGDTTTVNNNTVYYGPSIVLLASSGNGQTCDINAAGNVTEATADEPIYTSQAVHVLGMTCRNEGDANAAISFTLRNAAGATTPSVTCSIADNARDCVADVQTTTVLAAGSTVAIAAASTSDVGDNTGFVCNVAVAY